MVGYRAARGGFVTLARGNVDALYPNSPDAKRRKRNGTFTSAPFLSPRLVRLPVGVRGLRTGDFDRDGDLDVALAPSPAHYLAGDGRGALVPTSSAGAVLSEEIPASAEVSMRLNDDGPLDVVVLRRGRTVPAAVLSTPPVTLTVNDAGDGFDADPADGLCDADPDEPGEQCTLKAAVGEARVQGGATIEFAIGSGPVTIDTGAVSLPLVGRGGQDDEVPLTIDGTTQPGYDGTPLIRLREPASQAGAFPMVVLAPGSLLRGLILDEVSTSKNGGAVIEGNWIGLDETGEAASGFAAAHPFGVWLGGADNVVGGTAAAARNVIAGQQRGIHVASGSSDVVGNLIGTDVAGTAEIGFPAPTGLSTQGFAVFVAGGAGTVIGGTGESSGNVIAGARRVGVRIDHPAGDTVVQGNLIGTDITGMSALSNRDGGIVVRGAVDTVIGGPGSAGNVISGNALGVLVGVFSPGNVRADSTTVERNLIGLAVDGSTPLPNDADGVTIRSGRALIADNVISANGVYGVQLQRCEPSCIAATTEGSVVRDNLIGTTADGTEAVGNAFWGLLIGAGETQNTVTDNVISGNGWQGVWVRSGARDNVISENLIGTDATGTTALGNAADTSTGAPAGILLDGALETVVTDNIVSGNSGDGVHIVKQVGLPNSGSSNVLEGNKIGTDAAGTDPLGNEAAGVAIVNATANRVGGPGVGEANVISGNADGLVIRGESATGNLIEGNWIGTDALGLVALANAGDGIRIEGAAGNVIGGAGEGLGNVISGHDGGVAVRVTNGAVSNVVQGNLIGTGANGLGAIPNGEGVSITDGSENTIGGTDEGAGNIIAANSGHGVLVTGPSADNTIQGNLIGLDAGHAVLGNGGFGVLLEDSPDNLVGGVGAGAGNVVSGNQAGGVLISGAGATGNRLEGNRIGTSPSGAADRDNGGSGVEIQGAPGNLIGGTELGAGNVISGNDGDGILIAGASANANRIEGNRIGTTLDGLAAVGNAASGIRIEGSPSNVVGGLNTAPGTGCAAACNLVSGNGGKGVEIVALDAADNVVQGNFIGTSAAGAAALPNTTGVYVEFAPRAQIGGLAPGTMNLISGNGNDGVALIEANDARVTRNRIGTNLAGTAGLANGSAGIFVRDSSRVLIGGDDVAAGNLISGNGGHGVHLQGGGDAQHRLLQNLVGMNVVGAVPIPNEGHGVFVEDSSRNLIGAPDTGNVISGNAFAGLRIADGSDGNTVEANLIGTDEDGTLDRGNESAGIVIFDSHDNRIGGEDEAAANTVAFNGAVGGVAVQLGTRNAILGNSIFDNEGIGIDLGLAGVTANDTDDADLGANQLQNFPELRQVTTVRVAGTLDGHPSETYRVELFTNDACDPALHGEGKSLLGAVAVTTDAGGDGSFGVGVELDPGQVVTATATDPGGNTSEFSGCAVAGNEPQPQPQPQPPPPPPPAGAALPTLTISNAKVKEGNRGTKAMTFLVRLSSASATPVTVGFKTQKGTAKPKSDFVGRSGVLTFAPGQTLLKVVVKIKGDLRDERNEKFKVLLANVVGAALLDAEGIGTIRDNDP